MSEKKLAKEVLEMVEVALSEYFGDKLSLTEYSYDDDAEWLYRVKTDWLYNNRGVFARVITRYYIQADVVQHKFENEEETYRNGKVFRIHPHVSWEHHGGGTNGSNTEDEMIVIKKTLSRWFIEKTLR